MWSISVFATRFKPVASRPRRYWAQRLGTFALLAGLFLGLLSPADAPAQDAYVLGAGDRVRVTIFGEAELSGDFQIDGQGDFPMPLIGTVAAAGMSPRMLEQHLVRLFSDGYLVNPQIGVEVLNFRPFFILGEVRTPGSFPYREGLTVLNAVALAGGFTYRADEDDIEITRGGDTTKPPVAATLETVVQPGDLIRVTERIF